MTKAQINAQLEYLRGQRADAESERILLDDREDEPEETGDRLQELEDNIKDWDGEIALLEQQLKEGDYDHEDPKK